MCAGRDEDIEAIWMLVLHPLKERRKVGHCARGAHANLVNDFTPGLLEGGLECKRRVLSGRKVSEACGGGLATKFGRREGAHRVASIPHTEGKAHNVRRQAGD